MKKLLFVLATAALFASCMLPPPPQSGHSREKPRQEQGDRHADGPDQRR